MVKIIMHGCNGKMGRFITNLCENDENAEVVAGVDVTGQQDQKYPVYASVAECDVEADVVVDFSTAAAADKLIEDCVAKKLPLALCTTALSEEQLLKAAEAAKKIAVLRSANMSVGINILMKVLSEVSETLAKAGFDIEIVEKHHNQKLDAPSGTALALADAVNDGLSEKYDYVYDRSGRREKRPKKEIGISALRCGTLPGDHEVIFAGNDEVISFHHTSYSRGIFAKGAIEAAKFLAGKPAGMYDMSEVIG